MPRTERVDVGDHVYHVINRANGKHKIFEDAATYKEYETILQDGIEKFAMLMLATSPVSLPRGYRAWINAPESVEQLKTVRISVNKGIPYGRELWRDKMISKFSLQQVLRSPRRPKKKENGG